MPELIGECRFMLFYQITSQSIYTFFIKKRARDIEKCKMERISQGGRPLLKRSLKSIHLPNIVVISIQVSITSNEST